MSNKTYLKVTKKPRDRPIVDKPIKFEPLQNLHLELIEVKSKLKPGLPLIPQSKPKLQPKSPVTSTSSTTSSTNTTSSTSSTSKSNADPGTKKDDKENQKSKIPESITIDIIRPVVSKHDTKKEKFENVEKSKHHKKKDKHKVKKIIEKEEKEDEEEEEINEEKDEEKNTDIEPQEEEKEEEGKEDEEEDIYAGLTPEEREIKEKEEYIWRFRILKKQYGKHATIEIPSWNEHSDLHMMKTSYERTIRELYLDDAVETYKTYLIGGWIVMEYVCTQIIGIDLRGFTVYQIKIMYKYERMLIELGEKSYTRWGMNLPVEVRLIGMILFQAGIFYLAKIISDKFGSNLAEIFRGFTGQPPPGTDNSNGNNKENNDNEEIENDGKKMKGPKIRAEDIRKRRAEKTS